MTRKKAMQVPCAQVIWFLYLKSVPLIEVATRCDVALSVVDRAVRHIPKHLRRHRKTRRQLEQAGRRAALVETAQELRGLGASPQAIGEVFGVSEYLVRQITSKPSCSLKLLGQEEERQAILTAYAAPGASLRSVGAAVGVSHDTVWRVVRDAGVAKPRIARGSMVDSPGAARLP